MILLIILWILFFFSHSLLAANAVKAIAEKLLGKYFRFYRIAYNLLSLIFLSTIFFLLARQKLDYVFAKNEYLSFAGYVLISVGGLIITLAFKNYDMGVFTGIKQIAQKIHHPDTLTIKGLNHYVRNPLYFGTMLFFAGYFLQQPTCMNLISVCIIYAYIYAGTKLEEKKLEEAFGDEYRAYKKKVKMLIPYAF